MTTPPLANNPEEYSEALQRIQSLHAENEAPRTEPQPSIPSELSSNEIISHPDIAVEEIVGTPEPTENTRLSNSIFIPLITVFAGLPFALGYLYLFKFVEPLARVDIALVFFSFVAIVLAAGYCFIIQTRVVIMRLRDAGKRQALAALWFIPIVNVALLAYLIVQPTQPFENHFGLPGQKAALLRRLLRPLVVSLK